MAGELPANQPAGSRRYPYNLRTVKHFVVVLLAASLLLSCSGERKTPPAGDTATKAPADDTPRDGGTLYRRLESDVSSLNPILANSSYDRRVAHYLFTPLLHIDQSLRPIAGVAESWEISDDGRRYTFKLNEKATFSDGKPVRASDVLFTVRKIVDPASEAAQIASGFEQYDDANSKVIDDHTVVIAFKDALASQLIRFNDLIVIPEHVYGKGKFRDDFNDTAVGTGPYRLVRRTAGKEVVLERRPDYWGVRPHIQAVHFKVIADHNTAWQAIRRGDVDETMIPSDVWAREHERAEHRGKIEFRRFYSLNYNYVAWNGRHPILSDKRVRHALAKCVNLKSVINDLYHGTARAVTGHFTAEEWAYNPKVAVIEFDPDGARKDFEALGWRDTNNDGILDKDGKPLAFELIIMAGGSTGAAFAQLYQADLRRVGVDLDIATLDGASAIQRILAGNYQAAFLAWELDPDPDPFSILHSSQIPPRGQNFVYYASPEADRLIEAGRREMDFDKRVELYHRLHEVMAADQPYTWTVQVSLKWALTNRVRGVRESRGYGLLLWYPGELGWWLAEDKPATGR